MKVVFAAALAAFAFSAAAFAQTPPPPPVNSAAASQTPVPPSRCPAFPAPPTLPDGATARNSRVMQEGDAAYQAYGIATQQVLECRRAEAEELLIYARQHEARVQEYNAAVSQLNAVGVAWQAEAAEYNARTTPPARR